MAILEIVTFTGTESQFSRCSGPFPDSLSNSTMAKNICKAGHKQKQQLQQHGQEGKLKESSPSLPDCINPFIHSFIYLLTCSFFNFIIP